MLLSRCTPLPCCAFSAMNFSCDSRVARDFAISTLDSTFYYYDDARELESVSLNSPVHSRQTGCRFALGIPNIGWNGILTDLPLKLRLCFDASGIYEFMHN